MPKDEPDSEDPMMLNGVVVPAEAGATEIMTEAFIEEFIRMRYSGLQILKIFSNPVYIGPQGVWKQRGEEFVREQIEKQFLKRGRTAFPTNTGEGNL